MSSRSVVWKLCTNKHTLTSPRSKVPVVGLALVASNALDPWLALTATWAQVTLRRHRGHAAVTLPTTVAVLEAPGVGLEQVTHTKIKNSLLIFLFSNILTRLTNAFIPCVSGDTHRTNTKENKSGPPLRLLARATAVLLLSTNSKALVLVLCVSPLTHGINAFVDRVQYVKRIKPNVKMKNPLGHHKSILAPLAFFVTNRCTS
jgi:hypothetical protein